MGGMARGQVIKKTDFAFPGQVAVYHGKVREVYDFGDSLMMVTSDRYSAFDRILAMVPNKGELLVATTRWWFEQTKHIVKNHVIDFPDPNVMWGKKYKVVPIEMVVRGYITGVTNTSLWYHYSQGQRDFGDFVLPEGLQKNQKLPDPALTPSTKFEEHDRTLTPQQAVAEGLIDAEIWRRLQEVALKLFRFGQEKAESKGLILVDTKYEFGLDEQNNLILIDEIHTQDSSRYWRKDTYEQQLDKGEEPDYHDKEFLRLWFKERFDPYKDKTAPKAPVAVIDELRARYIYVYEQLTGKRFVPAKSDDPVARIEANVLKALKGGSNE